MKRYTIFLVSALLLLAAYAVAQEGYTGLTSLNLTEDLIVGDDATITDDLAIGGDLSMTGSVNLPDDVALVLGTNDDVSCLYNEASTDRMTCTFAAATSGLNILVGSLFVGNGSPGQTINGEDAYIEGLVEIDGVLYGDGGAVIASALNLSYATATTVPYLDASKNLVSSAVTPTELGYVSGVTSGIQGQLDLLAPIDSPAFTTQMDISDWATASELLATDASGLVVSVTGVSDTEAGYLDGVTSAIQTQLDGMIEGPSGATDNAIVRYDGATGYVAQDSGVTISDDNIVSAEATPAGGADVEHLFKTTLQAGETYTGSTGMTIKTYDADATVVHDGGELFGLSIWHKQLSAMNLGGESSILSLYQHASTTVDQNFGLRLFGDYADASMQFAAGSAPYIIDMDLHTGSTADIRFQNGEILDNATDGELHTDAEFEADGGYILADDVYMSIGDAPDWTLGFDAAGSGYLECEAAAASDVFNFLVGNVMIGDGTPGNITGAGEEFYCEGASEFDGMLYADGRITAGESGSELDLSGASGSNSGVQVHLTDDGSGSSTGLKGGDFRAAASDGTSTSVVGVQSVATRSGGAATTAELTGGNFNAYHTGGTVVNSYGAIGLLNMTASATHAGAANNVATGLLGYLYVDTSATFSSDPIIAGVASHIADDTGGNAPYKSDAAYAALLGGDTHDVDCGAVLAAYTNNSSGGYFDYGIDFNALNEFAQADIRLVDGQLIESGGSAASIEFTTDGNAQKSLTAPIGYVSATEFQTAPPFSNFTSTGIEGGGQGVVGSADAFVSLSDAADEINLGLTIPELATVGAAADLLIEFDIIEDTDEECNIDIVIYEYGNATPIVTDSITLANAAARAWVGLDTATTGIGDVVSVGEFLIIEITATADTDQFKLYGARVTYSSGVENNT